MPYGRFLLANALSALMTMTVMEIGYDGGNNLQIIVKDTRRLEHLTVVVVLTAITAALLIR